jgi:hypothetical protein
VKQWNRTFVNQEPQRFQSINPWWLLNTKISYIVIHISIFVMESNKYHWWLNYMNIDKTNHHYLPLNTGSKPNCESRAPTFSVHKSKSVLLASPIIIIIIIINKRNGSNYHLK